MSNIQNSSRTNEWGTPHHILELVRRVISPIELDPCSTFEWNSIVKANEFLSDSLNKEWCKSPKSVFINPPGGKLRNKSLSCSFWHALCEHKRKGLIKHAIWMGFSLEQLATSQKYDNDLMLYYPLCIPKERVHFDSAPGIPGNIPTHANFILYMPGNINETSKFLYVFKSLGSAR